MLCYITTEASVRKLSRSLNIKREMQDQKRSTGRPHMVVTDTSDFLREMIHQRFCYDITVSQSPSKRHQMFSECPAM